MNINFVEIFGAFFVMAAIIDIFGSIPIFVSMREQNKVIKAGQACLVALALFLTFFFAGDGLLRVFGIDAASFAVAGSFGASFWRNCQQPLSLFRPHADAPCSRP